MATEKLIFENNTGIQTYLINQQLSHTAVYSSERLFLYFCIVKYWVVSFCYDPVSASDCCIMFKYFSYMLFDELQRFLGEIKSGNFTVSNSENTTFYSELVSLFVNSFYQR